MVGLIFGAVHAHLLAGQHLGGAVDDIDAVLLQQELDALVHRRGHTAAAVDHGVEVGLHTLGLEAVGGGMLGIVERLGALHQGLGGDTTPVQADATQVFALHNGGLQAQLGTFHGSHIASRAAANHH